MSSQGPYGRQGFQSGAGGASYGGGYAPPQPAYGGGTVGGSYGGASYASPGAYGAGAYGAQIPGDYQVRLAPAAQRKGRHGGRS